MVAPSLHGIEYANVRKTVMQGLGERGLDRIVSRRQPLLQNTAGT